MAKRGPKPGSKKKRTTLKASDPVKILDQMKKISSEIQKLQKTYDSLKAKL